MHRQAVAADHKIKLADQRRKMERRCLGIGHVDARIRRGLRQRLVLRAVGARTNQDNTSRRRQWATRTEQCADQGSKFGRGQFLGGPAVPGKRANADRGVPIAHSFTVTRFQRGIAIKARYGCADSEDFRKNFGVPARVEPLVFIGALLAEARSQTHIEPCSRVFRILDLSILLLRAHYAIRPQLIDTCDNFFLVIERVDNIERFPANFFKVRNNAVNIWVARNQRHRVGRCDSD
jgi:hypothetical protein